MYNLFAIKSLPLALAIIVIAATLLVLRSFWKPGPKRPFEHVITVPSPVSREIVTRDVSASAYDRMEIAHRDPTIPRGTDSIRRMPTNWIASAENALRKKE